MLQKQTQEALIYSVLPLTLMGAGLGISIWLLKKLKPWKYASKNFY